MSAEKYAQYIAEQEKRNLFNSSKGTDMKGFKQFVAEEFIAEAEDSAVTKKVMRSDPDAMHVGTTGHEHVYAGAGDGGEHVYHVHNTKTGKTHSAALDHGGTDTYSHAEVHKEFGGDSKVSKAASKIAHNDHKEEMKGFTEEFVAEDSGDSFRHDGGNPNAASDAAKVFNKHDDEHEMITSHQHEHGAALPNKGKYAIHNTSTGKTQTFPEPTKKLSKDQFNAHMKKHGVEVQHKETAHHLHQDHLIQHD